MPRPANLRRCDLIGIFVLTLATGACGFGDQSVDRDEAIAANVEALSFLSHGSEQIEFEHDPIVDCPDNSTCEGVTEPIIGYRSTASVAEPTGRETVAVYGPQFVAAGWQVGCIATAGPDAAHPFLYYGEATNGTYNVVFQEFEGRSTIQIEPILDATAPPIGFWYCGESGYTPDGMDPLTEVPPAAS